MIYGIAFKWEVPDTCINWCESMLMRYDGRWALFRKGVCFQLPAGESAPVPYLSAMYVQ